jgi:hypothetical protein
MQYNGIKRGFIVIWALVEKGSTRKKLRLITATIDVLCVLEDNSTNIVV